MSSNFIGLLGSLESGKTSLAQMFGKKGLSSDLTFFSSNKEPSVSVIDPNKYPESFKTLLQTLQISDSYILCINAQKGIDKNFGEIIITLQSLWKKEDLNRGIIAITNREFIYDDNLLKKIKKMLEMSKFPDLQIVTTDINNKESITELKHKIKENLLSKGPRIENKNDPIVEIWPDHCFSPKGVGTVVLGKIISGTLEKGMKLTLLPGNKSIHVKNIQLNDIDAKEAFPGSHVGIAVKGISPDQMFRGAILLSEQKNGYSITKKIVVNTSLNKFSTPLSNGSTVHIIIGLDFVIGKIISIENEERQGSVESLLATQSGKLIIELSRETVSKIGTRVILCDLNKMPRILGFGEISE